jgi:CHAT domain-containing protein
MARAFLYAGARSAVASVWQVADRATAQLMEAMYRMALLERRPLPAALREAKLRLRRKSDAAVGESPRPERWHHPFYWAPFIYIGLPR